MSYVLIVNSIQMCVSVCVYVECVGNELFLRHTKLVAISAAFSLSCAVKVNFIIDL